MRLFIAALIPDTVRDALHQAREQLQRAAPDRALRWVAPENYHITLLFLGEQDEARLPAIVQAMEAARAGVPPFTVAVQGLGVFPNWNRPNVLWAGVSEGGRLLGQMAAALERTLLPAPSGKPFHPHITLARIKTPCRDADGLKKRLHDAVQRLMPATDFGRYELRSISLMQSTLTPDGSVYTELARRRAVVAYRRGRPSGSLRNSRNPCDSPSPTNHSTPSCWASACTSGKPHSSPITAGVALTPARRSSSARAAARFHIVSANLDADLYHHHAVAFPPDNVRSERVRQMGNLDALLEERLEPLPQLVLHHRVAQAASLPAVEEDRRRSDHLAFVALAALPADFALQPVFEPFQPRFRPTLRLRQLAHHLHQLRNRRDAARCASTLLSALLDAARSVSAPQSTHRAAAPSG
jgi:2'-5' RNA ligase